MLVLINDSKNTNNWFTIDDFFSETSRQLVFAHWFSYTRLRNVAYGMGTVHSTVHTAVIKL